MVSHAYGQQIYAEEMRAKVFQLKDLVLSYPADWLFVRSPYLHQIAHLDFATLLKNLTIIQAIQALVLYLSPSLIL